MNIIEGLNIQGFQLNVAENYNSIPGLCTWIDGRYRITEDVSNKISFAGDLSPELNNFSQPTDSRQPTWEDDKWIKSLSIDTATPMYLRSLRMEDFKFLHDGNPFGIYTITNFEGNEGTQNHYPLIAGGAGITGIRFIIAVTGVLQAIVNNGATIVRSVSLTGLYTPDNINHIETPNTFILSHVFKGANITNNQIIRLDDKIAIATDTSPSSDYSSSAAANFRIAYTTNDTKFIKTGITLIYDWRGFTPTQIDEFDSRVLALLNVDKQYFL